MMTFSANAPTRGVNWHAHKTWYAMLKRCYDEAYQQVKPTYIGCTVCEEWHTFSVFLDWYREHYQDGYELDKDLLIVDNKLYSPTTCLMIPKWLNVFFTNRSRCRGDYPLGVSYYHRNGKYRGQVSIDGKIKSLGYFDTPELAHAAWRAEKIKYLTARKLEVNAIYPNLFDNCCRLIK